MNDQIFADGVVGVSVAAGVVRMELGVVKRTDATGKGALQAISTLNIPIEGFALTMAALQPLLDKLVKDGVVKPKTGSGAAGPKSPNFQ